jgi:hypothetical protein
VSGIKSVPNLIYYLHEFFWNFYQFLANCFELFSSESIFNSKNRCHGVPLVSLSLSAPGPPVSTPFPRGCHAPVPAQRHKGAGRQLRSDIASPLSKPRRRLTVGAPPDRACLNAAVFTVRARPAPPPVRPSRRCFPASPHHRVLLRSQLLPLTILSPSMQELAVRSRPIAGASVASTVATPSTVSGALSTPLPPFSLGTPAPELPPLSHPDAGHRRPLEHPPRQRTPPPSDFSTLPVGKKLR